MSSPANAPHLITIGPNTSVEAFHDPPGINGSIMGMIMFSTSDLTSDVDAMPSMKATAKATTLYSRRNSTNSDIMPVFATLSTFI